METDSEDKGNDGHCCLVGAMDSASEGIGDEQLCIFHLMGPSEKSLTTFGEVSGSFLLDPKITQYAKTFSSIFLVEFLMFLATSKDNRWASALLTEFGNGSKDVLEDIGRAHREVLWQISLHEDAKPEVEETTGDVGRKESDEQRSYYSSCCDMMRSLSFHITHLFQELGKVMFLPSHRRDDILNVSPSSKSMASSFASIALDRMNFGGHVNPSGTGASISTKCRYFGKVIDFIDGFLLDKPDSCNPVLLNCLYGHGVIQSVLTTFEATSQLLTKHLHLHLQPFTTFVTHADSVVELKQQVSWTVCARANKLLETEGGRGGKARENTLEMGKIKTTVEFH
ncbi:E3 ubiquitin-protein ligase UPL2 [Morella rubra]|uniref:E3 ubiquitin-protein ligase UPL2 n=1 Tax=Morella rubra TaxID=262757 RepID=A0A6A1UP34_9ROSI|nr:E3 ubiquitin-protein ligase UPL2 [Morella rubra]